ncbi:MAG TPA: PAS domain S-box protein [Chloroflexota bacterium]|nr:PAS domain S-box protein [Chloroflexota bacterium]
MVAFRHDDDLFRLLINAVEDYAIFMVALDGTILSWNSGAERLAGYTASEVIGQRCERFYVPEDLAAGLPDSLLAQTRAAGRVETEGWRLRKDGTRFWANEVITAVHDDNGTVRGFAKVTRDLTQRRSAEEALRQSEEHFRLLVADVQEYAMFVLSTEGNVVTWNAGAQRLKGYTFEEIVGQSFERFYSAEDRASGRPRRLLALARDEGRAHDEGWRIRKDGTRFWADVVITALYDDDRRLRGYAKVTRDLTERRQAEEQRAMRLGAERVVERLGRLQHVTAALAAASHPEEVAELLGSAGVAAVGAAAGAVALPVAGEDVLEVVHVSGYGEGSVQLHQKIRRTDPYTLAQAWRSMEPLFLSSRDEVRRAHPHLAPLAARSRYEAWASVPLLIERRLVGVMTLSFSEPQDFDPDERGFVLALGEVAAQALDRAALFGSERRARAEAEAAVQAQDEFLSIASHELRTPVAVVKATAQLAQRAIQRGTFDLARFQHNLEVINRASDRLTGLVEDLLDVSRLRTGQLQLRRRFQDVAPLLQEVVERYRVQTAGIEASHGQRHEFTLSVPDQVVEMYVDASRLEQVLDNFLSNAVKYSPAGGEISVTLSLEAGAARITVSDPGIGLPAGQEERIFEPFGRASNAAEQQIPGLGLGLAICRQLIEAHGGRVWATSPGEQKGTSIVVLLPEADVQAQQASA